MTGFSPSIAGSSVRHHPGPWRDYARRDARVYPLLEALDRPSLTGDASLASVPGCHAAVVVSANGGGLTTEEALALAL